MCICACMYICQHDINKHVHFKDKLRESHRSEMAFIQFLTYLKVIISCNNSFNENKAYNPIHGLECSSFYEELQTKHPTSLPENGACNMLNR